MLNDRVLTLVDEGGRFLGESRSAIGGSVDLTPLPIGIKEEGQDVTNQGVTNIDAYRQFLKHRHAVLAFIGALRARLFPMPVPLKLDEARLFSCAVTCLPEYAIYRGRLGWDSVLPEYVAAAIKAFMGMNKLLNWISAQSILAGKSVSAIDPRRMLTDGKTAGLFWDGAERCPVSGSRFLEVAHAFIDPPSPDTPHPLDLPINVEGLSDYAMAADRFLICAMTRVHLVFDLEANALPEPRLLEAPETREKLFNFLAAFASEETVPAPPRPVLEEMRFHEVWTLINRVCAADAAHADTVLKNLFPNAPPPKSAAELAGTLPPSRLDRLI